ncbi:MAG: transposase [Xenococcaceae cyanobacterium]
MKKKEKNGWNSERPIKWFVGLTKAIKEFFKKQVEGLTIFQLPSYSPDFNPIEFL